MGCGGCEPQNTATYVCKACGKEETRDAAPDEEVKSCCGQTMEKKTE